MSSSGSQVYATVTLTLLRVVAGFLFMPHGAQKIFGWFGRNGQTAPFLDLAWFAGVLELVGGALILVGLFTRPVAFLLSGLMAVAYFKAHAPQGLWPILNRGELAALYSFIFLYLSAVGGGPYALERVWRRGK